jgi:hypothetical protein
MVRASASLSFSRALRHDQLLLERLIIHAGAQLIEQRRGAGLVIGTAWSSETFAVATCASTLATWVSSASASR